MGGGGCCSLLPPAPQTFEKSPSRDGGGCSFKCVTRVQNFISVSCEAVRLSYGCSPVANWIREMPRPQISAEKEYCLPSRRSGDMYVTVPTKLLAPALVFSSSEQTPKSVTFGREVGFEGFRPRFLPLAQS